MSERRRVYYRVLPPVHQFREDEFVHDLHTHRERTEVVVEQLELHVPDQRGRRALVYQRVRPLTQGLLLQRQRNMVPEALDVFRTNPTSSHPGPLPVWVLDPLSRWVLIPRVVLVWVPYLLGYLSL